MLAFMPVAVSQAPTNGEERSSCGGGGGLETESSQRATLRNDVPGEVSAASENTCARLSFCFEFYVGWGDRASQPPKREFEV